MISAILIGHIGANAETKNSNGNEFTTFRVAHSSTWKGQNGTVHEESTWVDCILNGRPAVTEYLVKGALVYIAGNCSLRIYSSKKDRCMKAGLTINVRDVQLLGGKPDEVPSRLFDPDTGIELKVNKYYGVDTDVLSKVEGRYLYSKSGDEFLFDKQGWIYPSPREKQADNNNNEGNQV